MSNKSADSDLGMVGKRRRLLPEEEVKRIISEIWSSLARKPVF